MKLKIVVCVLITSLIVSCKKEPIKELPAENSPVFTAKGNFLGENFELLAGEKGVYMNTFTEVVNGIQKYSGNIGNSDLNIEIGMYKGDNDINGNVSDLNIPNVVTGAFQITTPLVTLNKDNFYNASTIQQVKWYVNSEYKGLNVFDIYLPGLYEVTAVVKFNSGLEKSLTNKILIGYKSNAIFKMNHLVEQNDKLKAWIDIYSGTIESIIWKINDQIISTNLSIETQIYDGDNIVSAEVHFTNGIVKTQSFYYNEDSQTDFISDFSNYEINPLNPLKWDYKFLVKATKKNLEYRSDFSNNSNFSINILNTSYYGKNNNGNRVYKIEANVSTDLKGAQNGDVVPITFNTNFGIEIK